LVTFSRSSAAGHEVVIVGAGAAGVAAGRILKAAGVDALIVEARDRVGGRAHTIDAGLSGPLDMGCEWLHSADRNVLVEAAEGLGLTIDRARPDWGSHAGRNFPPEQRAAFQTASERFWDSLEREAQAGGPDRPAAELLEPGNPWNPLIQAISTYYNGVELDRVSIIDLDRYVDTGVNWRIAEGYGTLIERAARKLDIALGTPVSQIDHSGPRLRLRTPRGDIHARTAIVTVPTGVIAAGGLTFVPDLPDKRAAAAGLPLGLADKIFFQVDAQADLPGKHVFGTTDRVETISFDLRPRGWPIIQGFVGGAFARALEDEGPAGFEAAARHQLGTMLGNDVQKHLTFLEASAWARDPWSRGSYSHARPGAADERAVLAAPVDERIFFAGEACSERFFSTAHGAWETGIAAAQALLKSRRVAPRNYPVE
jgi:monoamine oxidase